MRALIKAGPSILACVTGAGAAQRSRARYGGGSGSQQRLLRDPGARGKIFWKEGVRGRLAKGSCRARVVHGAEGSGSRRGAEARRHGEDLGRRKGKVLASGAGRSAG